MSRNGKRRLAVVGMGIFGRQLALSLARRNVPVLAVDRDGSKVEAVKDDVDQALRLDTTDETALTEADIHRMDTVVVAIGNRHVQDSIMTVALLRKLEVSNIVARAVTSLHERILRQVGATLVVNPEEAMGDRMALQLANEKFWQVFSLAEGTCVAEIRVPTSFVGRSLRGLDVRNKYGVTVVGVNRSGATRKKRVGVEPFAARDLILNFKPEEQFQQDDTLIVVGSDDDVERLGELD